MKTRSSKKQKALKAGRKSSPKSTRARTVSSPEQPVGEEHHSHGEQVIVGIDPANDSCGLCVLNREGNIYICLTLSVWEPIPKGHVDTLYTALEPGTTAKIYYERSPVRGKPANDAISRAAGMLIQTLRDLFFKTLKRNDVHAVEPATWRKAIYGNARPMDPKAGAIQHYMAAIGQIPMTHDAAEAYCIAKYGWIKERGNK